MIGRAVRILTCTILGILLIASNAVADEKETEFWKWFEANDRMLYEFEVDQERVFDRLQAELHKVHPDLTFEFGPTKDGGWREFVISADGFRKAFPAVESLFSQAPELDRWKFVKFRPRRTPMPVCFGDRCVEPEDVNFQLFRDGDKIGIVLFFERYDEQERDFFSQVGFLMLDGALGEFTVETEVGFIDFTGRNSEYYNNELTLPGLAQAFDNTLMQK